MDRRGAGGRGSGAAGGVRATPLAKGREKVEIQVSTPSPFVEGAIPMYLGNLHGADPSVIFCSPRTRAILGLA
jgi:hypothetical protein